MYTTQKKAKMTHFWPPLGNGVYGCIDQIPRELPSVQIALLQLLLMLYNYSYVSMKKTF